MSHTIDLNADLGEGFPWDEELLNRVTSASVCCGAYAGDEVTILGTLRAAMFRNVEVGAHPGYADRAGFGRREQVITRAEVMSLVRDQVIDLAVIAESVGIEPSFVKPHGALYNQAQRDPEVAQGIVDAICGVAMLKFALFGLPDTELSRAAERSGITYIAEGFADRGYASDGSLIPRGQPGAILDDPDAIADQIARLVDSGRVQTLCFHGDDPLAVERADIARATLDRLGIAVRRFGP